jgi:hypothetical protein
MFLLNQQTAWYSAQTTQGSSALAPGTILAAVDKPPSVISDQTIPIPGHKGDQTDLLIWDYAAEDGDWVQVLVDGLPESEPFMILHQPRRISVPVGSVVTVLGIRDGGGGITYAVNFPAAQRTVRNGAPLGNPHGNAYTLTPSLR